MHSERVEEDGFSSNQQENNFDGLPNSINHRFHTQPRAEKIIKFVEPAQEIKDKSYSLQPDIATGWKPKIVLNKPVPLTFPWSPLDLVLKELAKKENQDIKLVYLGPRFNDTYSAWKALSVPFPYSHMGELKIALTDRKFIGMAVPLPPKQPHFDSLFQSGNLDCAIKVGQDEYDCFMRVDANTAGHFQWFYFRMSNLRPHGAYRIHICNFQKVKSLYSRSMKPYVRRRSKQGWSQWVQAGQDIDYCQNRPKTFSKLSIDVENKYYQLSFTIKNEHHNDSVEIAYCPPYSYTCLLNQLQNIHSNNRDSNIIRQENLCLSLGSLRLPLLTVTSNVAQQQQCFKNQQPVKDKFLIFLMARIHPGQSNGSHMAKGFLQWVCGSTTQAQQLRKTCVIKILPMVNPDGVIIGNYRTGLSGSDFNRKFSQTQNELFVQVGHLKRYLQKCRWIYHHKFLFFFDFHGHSVKKNVFAYGPQYPITSRHYYQCRIFPKLLSRKTSLFRFYSCVFRVHPSKSATARAVLLRQLGIPFVFTIQASNGFYYDYQVFEDRAFVIEWWIQTGQKVGETLHQYLAILNKIQQQKTRKIKQKQIIVKRNLKSRIQSSYMKGYPTQKSKNNHNRHEKSAFSHIDNFALQQLLNQLEGQNKQKQVQFSDDEVSEGKSDSQGSQDDLDQKVLQQLFRPPQLDLEIPKEKIDAPKKKKKMQVKPIKVQRQKNSFLTQLNTFKQETIMMKSKDIDYRRKITLIRRRQPTSNATPSPTKQPAEKGSAKVINLSFCLTTVPSLGQSAIKIPQACSVKLKTQGDGEMYRTTLYRAQAREPNRRTFMSLQRDMLMKKQTKKSHSTTMNSFTPHIHLDYVVGKRIFE